MSLERDSSSIDPAIERFKDGRGEKRVGVVGITNAWLIPSVRSYKRFTPPKRGLEKVLTRGEHLLPQLITLA
jgi:hypothetical protein